MKRVFLKKTVSAFLLVCMLMTLAPVSAFASDGEAQEIVPEETSAAAAAAVPEEPAAEEPVEEAAEPAAPVAEAGETEPEVPEADEAEAAEAAEETGEGELPVGLELRGSTLVIAKGGSYNG